MESLRRTFFRSSVEIRPLLFEKKKTKFDLAYSSPDICDVWFVEVQVSYGFEN